ncbi:MAG TPA: hypothetical protein VF118_10860 [Gemmatimonadaceae bacterium]
MITAPAALEALDLEQARTAYRGLSYHDALARFTALWCYAREINPEIGANWRHDVEADIAVARALNGLSPTT